MKGGEINGKQNGNQIAGGNFLRQLPELPVC